MTQQQPQAGQIRPIPDSDLEAPAGKRPRLEPAKTHIAKSSSSSTTTTTTTTVNAIASSETTNAQKPKSKRKFKQKRPDLPEPCSPEDVLWHEISAVLGADVVANAIEEGVEYNSPFAFHQEVDVVVKSLSPGGDAVAVPVNEEERHVPWVIIVPFSLPGEVVRVRVYRNARMHSVADLVNVVNPNTEIRDDSRVQCRYFGRCGGCQYQMLSSETQLALKRDVIVKAYKNFSGLPESLIPPVQPTIGSPLQYGYRTKITPHFEAAPKSLSKKREKEGTTQEELVEQPDWLKIGFNVVGTRKVLDIEECPIATPIINQGLITERQKIIKNAYTYKKGVSLILRDSLDISVPLPPPNSDDNSNEIDHLSEALSKHVCITSHKATIREKVGNLFFEYPASSFFQNNNSVLVPLTEYVRDAIFPSSIDNDQETRSKPKPTHLVDTYCGSGLFALSLSPYFNTISGIELSSESIRSARHNVILNHIKSPPSISFQSGTASDIFSSVRDFPREETVVVIDPPRKGCDDEFVKQVVEFRPGVVVYVSCNVHTQARDIGKLLRMTEGEGMEEKEKGGRGKYVLESLRGFDLFPQTAHVESVAILRLG